MKRICVILLVVMAFVVSALCRTTIAEILTLPESVTSAEEEAFFGDESLETVGLPGRPADAKYVCAEYAPERNGIRLHLDRFSEEGTAPQRSILLIHGVTYSSSLTA